MPRELRRFYGKQLVLRLAVGLYVALYHALDGLERAAVARRRPPA